MISRADSRGPPPNTTYEIIRLVRPLLRHLLKAVGNNLTGTGQHGSDARRVERRSESGPQAVHKLAQVLLVPRQFAQQPVNELSVRVLLRPRKPTCARLRPRG
jgi:hypothetical protein